MSRPISRRRPKFVGDGEREHHTDAKVMSLINNVIADKSGKAKTYGEIIDHLRQVRCYAIPDKQWLRVVQFRELQIKLSVVGNLMVGQHICKSCKHKKSITDYENCLCCDCDRTLDPCDDCGSAVCDCPE